jgi:putative ABC transport system ATP-binding protein
LASKEQVSAVIEFQNVTRSFEQGRRCIHALRDVSFRVEEGEFVAIFGRSGSGKSTILNLCCGIDNPTEGEVTVSGNALSGLSDRKKTLLRRREIGIVFQFFNLIPTLTVMENILLPPLLAGGSGRKARERARHYLGAVGLAKREDSFPDQLSGGEQQRLAVVRAVMNDPRIILADEPTGNLDSENAGFILDCLSDFSRKHGRTVLMVTHSAEAMSYAQRMLHLRDGELVG